MAAAAATVTVAVVALPFIRFAYRAPAVHVALETADAIIALLVAYLIYGRFRDSRRAQELLLVLALCTLATANLVLSALPNAVALAEGEEFSRWAGLVIRFAGALLLVGAALTSPAARLAPRRAGAVGAGVTAGLVLLAAAGIAFGDRLPPTVDAARSLADASSPVLAAHPAVLVVQAVAALCYALAAIVLTHQARATGDQLMPWVAAGCVLGAAARVHYLLFPSLYSEFVYTGDLLRLSSYLLMLVGAAREIRSYWELRTRTAVMEDRRRTARDLHDGLAQELAYITAQSKRLAAQPDDVTVAERIGAAAARAQFEARSALRALTRPVDLPFPEALQQVVDDLALRYEIKAVTDLAPDVRLGSDDAEAVLRIVGEAVRNAVRHGEAQCIEIRLEEEPLCLSITDDGRGFATGPADGQRVGGFGLTSMRERASRLGADLSITSVPGAGTTVRVTWR
ncbi:sensor histidine kinase [Geodermatophilus sp. URMC 64]